MGLLGTFSTFARRILEASKKGGLTKTELKKLENLLSRTAKRNTVLAKGMLSALSAGGASQKDISRFSQILMEAENRVLTNQKPFSSQEQKEVNEIFKRAYISQKTAKWFSSQLDELVAEEINEFVKGARGIEAAVPAKKIVRFERTEEERREPQRRKMSL